MEALQANGNALVRAAVEARSLSVINDCHLFVDEERISESQHSTQ